jgi:cytochrome P450
MEPPEHRQYRAILDPIFSPQGVSKLHEDITRRANELIDGFQQRGACEFTEEFGRPLPVSVFLDLMGLPQDKRDTFVQWVADTLHTEDQGVILRATNDIGAYLKGVIAEKQAHPDAGAMSAIVHGRVNGVPLSYQQMFGFAFFVFIAGIDTVYATLNNIFLWLAQNPDRRREIIDNPGNIAQVVEELLRVFTVTYAGRTLTQDLELRGVAMKKGEKVLCALPTANFDPEVFPDPLRVDFNRPRKPILAFAGGVHSCMGAHLARMEIRVCLEVFLKRIPDFRVKDFETITYLPGAVVGPKQLPLVW